MTFSIVMPIIAAALLGVAGVVLYIALFVRGGNSTQQLRAAFFLIAFFTGCIGWGAVAFRQPISTPDTKTVYWGQRVAEAISFPLIVAGVALGVFQSFACRVALPAVTFIAMIALTLWPFVIGTSLWYGFGVACFAFVCFAVTIIFGDRLDVIEANIRGGHEHFPHWHGLVWRLLLILEFAVYLLFQALAPDTGVVFGVDAMYITSGVLDVLVMVMALFNYFLVVVVSAIYDKSNTGASQEQRVGKPLAGRFPSNNHDGYSANV